MFFQGNQRSSVKRLSLVFFLSLAPGELLVDRSMPPVSVSASLLQVFRVIFYGLKAWLISDAKKFRGQCSRHFTCPILMNIA